MITLDQAKQLTHGTTLYHMEYRNRDKSPQRWRVNGKPQTWKTQPHKVRVPIKHGMYDFDYLTQDDLDRLALTESEALEGPK
jgi:hypothetical protein